MFQPLSSDSSPNLINSVDRKRKRITEDPPQSHPQQNNIGTTAHDHTYANTQSPRKLRKIIDNITANRENLTRRLNTSQKKSHRLKKKVTTLQTVIDHLKKKIWFQMSVPPY